MSRYHFIRPAQVLLFATIVALLAAACGTDPEPTPEPTQPAGATATPSDTSDPATPTPVPQEPEVTFEGETIEFVVPFAPGGGFDVFARIFAQVAPDHFPGNPQFVVINEPGAAGLRGIQTLARSEPDGTSVTIMHTRWPMSSLVGEDSPFDLNDVTIIGSPTAAAAQGLSCIRREVATNWAGVEALGRDVTHGDGAPGNAAGPDFIELVGGPINNIYGYGGTSEVMAALDRGELDTARCARAQIENLYPEWAEDRFVTPLIYWGEPPGQDYLDWIGADEPPINTLDAVETTEAEETAFNAFVDLISTQRIFALPAGVPDDVVQAWRDAFAATIASNEFMELATAAGYADDVEFANAERIQGVFDDILGLPEDALLLLREMAPE